MKKNICDATFLTYQIFESVVNSVIFSEPNNVNLINQSDLSSMIREGFGSIKFLYIML